MASIFLIRHAESLWSPDDDRSLSAAGRVASERLGERLGSIGFEAIYASTYARAVETVEPLSRHASLSIRKLSALRERALGSFEGDFAEAVSATWGNLDLQYPGGESSRTATQRVLAVIQELAIAHCDDRPIAVASHGNVIALLLKCFDPSVGFEFWRSMTFPDVFHLQLSSCGDGTFKRFGGEA